MTPSQIPLSFPHRPTYEEADFLAAPSNEAARGWLKETSKWPELRLVLWGEAGCGKTHLLHIWSRRLGATALAAQALDRLPQLPETGGVAIDDADRAASEPVLLHLLNLLREARRPLLLASRLAPARWSVRLPDLASRLRAITAVEIHPPGDLLLRSLFLRLLADRQLAIRPPLQAWLLARLPRSPAALREAVGRLDQAALASGRAVTRPLAARALATMIGGEWE